MTRGEQRYCCKECGFNFRETINISKQHPKAKLLTNKILFCIFINFDMLN